MSKKNVVIIVSNVFKSFEFEWTAEFIDKEKVNLFFVLLNPGTSQLENFLQSKHIPFKRIKYREKKDFIPALFKTYWYLIRVHADIVHAHLFDASFIGLMAAMYAGVKKRIYTRHNSTFHQEYFPNMVKYNKLINSFATDIIAPSNVVKSVLTEREKVPANKISLINHGFNFIEFDNVSEKRVAELKKKYNPQNNRPVIGVISRYLHLKGIQYIIPAFKKLLSDYPDALLILANSDGDYKYKISTLLSEIPEKNKIEIFFEEDVFALYKLFDIFVHTPISSHIEAFGQIYVEALAANIPSVFTLSGIANDFIVNRQNALVVRYEDSESIYTAFLELLRDPALGKKLSEQGKKDVFQRYPLSNMIRSLEVLYS